VILALDPSSTCIGWAVFDETGGDAIDFGVLRPTPRKGTANEHIMSLAEQLRGLIYLKRPVKNIVIEDCDGKVGRAVRAGAHNQDIYGKAVGFYWCVAVGFVPAPTIHMVPVRTWTRGRPKAQRTYSIATRYGNGGGYDASKDPGGDVADAIGLGEWWMVENKLKELRA
jgi:hypothetical protein